MPPVPTDACQEYTIAKATPVVHTLATNAEPIIRVSRRCLKFFTLKLWSKLSATTQDSRQTLRRSLDQISPGNITSSDYQSIEIFITLLEPIVNAPSTITLLNTGIGVSGWPAIPTYTQWFLATIWARLTSPSIHKVFICDWSNRGFHNALMDQDRQPDPDLMTSNDLHFTQFGIGYVICSHNGHASTYQSSASYGGQNCVTFLSKRQQGLVVRSGELYLVSAALSSC